MYLFLRKCDNTPPAGSHYLNLLSHSWSSDHLVVSLISDKGISHFFTDTQSIAYTTECVEEKRTNKYGLGLASRASSEEFLTF